MSITFKHKIKRQAIFYNDLVPGRSLPGVNGSAGNTGSNGPSIYFSDYTPDDDYVKGILLDKIEKGIFLTSDNSQQLVGISYTPGDLIITEKKYIYKLIVVDGKYDLKFLGNMRSRTQTVSNTGKSDILDNLISVEAHNVTTGNQYLPVPSNRGIDSSTNLSTLITYYDPNPDATSELIGYTLDTDSSTRLTPAVDYSDAMKIAFGFKYFPIIRIENQSFADNYDFYLKIKMKVKKSLQGNSYTLDDSETERFYNASVLDPVPTNLYNVVEFYKYSEMKLKPVEASTDLSSYEYTTPDGFSRCCITDMTCDKLFPSGNNIASNIMPSSFVYQAFVEARPGAINTLHVSGSSYVGYDSSYYGTPGSTRNTDASAGEVYSDDKKMFKTDYYYNTLGFLQYSKRGKSATKFPNYRAGDSAYFSGITLDGFDYTLFADNPYWGYKSQHYSDTAARYFYPYYCYANHVNCLIRSFDGDTDDTAALRAARLNAEKNYVVEMWMKPFYFDPDNIYELTCVNKSTGETFTMNLKKIIIS